MFQPVILKNIHCNVFLFTAILTELLNYKTVFAICRHSARILNLRVILYISRIQNFVWPEELQTFQLLVTGKYLHVSILGTCTALLCEIPVADDFLQSLGPGGPWVFRPPNQFCLVTCPSIFGNLEPIGCFMGAEIFWNYSFFLWFQLEVEKLQAGVG